MKFTPAECLFKTQVDEQPGPPCDSWRGITLRELLAIVVAFNVGFGSIGIACGHQFSPLSQALGIGGVMVIGATIGSVVNRLVRGTRWSIVAACLGGVFMLAVVACIFASIVLCDAHRPRVVRLKSKTQNATRNSIPAPLNGR